jgi:fatty acid desaturase
MGVDEDIATDPYLFPWVPDPSQGMETRNNDCSTYDLKLVLIIVVSPKDSPLRKIQHWIFWVPFSFLFALWRFDSVTVVVNAIESKRPDAKNELYGLLVHYLLLLSVFPVSVWIPAIFISGLLTALIVTPTHQSEEMFEDYQDDWVSAQFRSTRNAVMTNPFSEWLWGGMQYQLEHHLFPSMPRNRYPQLREKLIAFANANQVPGGYRESGEFEILKMNWDLYRKVAEADPVPGAPMSRGRIGQQGAIRESSSPAGTVTKKS